MSKIKNVFVKSSYLLAILALVLAYFPARASAAAITNRSVVIGSSVASISTTYNFTFTAAQSTTIKSVGFAACTTASGACTPAPGFDSSASTLSSATNLGSGGTWTVNTATPGELRMANNSNTGSPSAGITANFSNAVNPSATNATFYIRITTYSDSTWTTPIDSGVVASSTAGQVTVTVGIDEMLTFTLATTAVTLTAPTTSSTGSGTSSMTVSTNGASGYSVSYTGSTLTSGVNTITALASPTASTTNVKQFGLNLMSNTTPSVGANVSGSGSGTASVDYNTTNQFKFNSGDTIAAAAAPTNNNTFTSSYIVNMDGSTAAGSYSTAITYIATANF